MSVAEVLAALARDGMVTVQSRVLEEGVVFLDGAPRQGTTLPIYSVEELRIIGERRPDVAELRVIHEAKRLMGAIVVRDDGAPSVDARAFLEQRASLPGKDMR